MARREKGSRGRGDDEPYLVGAARRAAHRIRHPAQPELRALRGVQATGAAGDALIAVALAGTLFFSVPETTARGRVALYLALTVAPFAIVAPLLARFLDRHRGGLRLVIVAASVGRGVLAWSLSTHLHSLYLFPLAFGILMGSRTTLIVRGAVIPGLLDDDRALVAANSSLARTTAAAGMVFGLVGWGLVHWPGERFELQLAAAVYGAGTLYGLRLPTVRGRRHDDEQAGARAAVRSQSMRQATVAITGFRLLTGFVVFHLAFALRREEAAAIGLGFLIASAAAGGFLGAVAAPRLRRRLREEGILIAMLGAAGVTGIATGRWFSILSAGVLVFVFGLTSGAAKVAFDSIVQREIPDSARGWAFARFESALQLAWVVGALAPLLVSIPSGPGMIAAGAVAIVLGFLYLVGRQRIGAVA